MAAVALAAWGASLLGAPAALACVVCLPYPETTHADRLLASDAVALAREDPSRPFSLSVVDVLKGRAADKSTGVFLPSAVRRQLTSKPADRIVLIRRDGAASWVRLSYAKPDYQAFARDILVNATEWRGDRAKPARFAFFAARLNHANGEVRQQAFLEVARAPYRWIRTVAARVPVEQVRAVLADWRLRDWHRLHILLLGQSKHAGDRAHIRARIETAARYGNTTNLAAWTIAYIETDPVTAIARIEARYFQDTERKSAELEAVLQALSVLATADGPLVPPRTAWLRRRLVGAYTVLLRHHPDMAGWVARDLMRWRRRVLVDALTTIRRDPAALDLPSALAVDTYLGMAARFTALAPLE